MKAIKGSGGVISTVAKRLGTNSWNTVYNYCHQWKETEDALNAEKETIIDMCEGVLYKSIKEGNTQDAKWLMARTKEGKKRGYGEDAPVVNVQTNIKEKDEIDLSSMTPEEREYYLDLKERYTKNE